MTNEMSQPITKAAPRTSGLDEDQAFAQQIAAQLRATADSKVLRRAMAISAVALSALLTGMVGWILLTGRKYVQDVQSIKIDATKFTNQLDELRKTNDALTQTLTNSKNDVEKAKQKLADTQLQLQNAQEQLNNAEQQIRKIKSELDQQIQVKINDAVAVYRKQLTESTEKAKKEVEAKGEAVRGTFAEARETADNAKRAANEAARSIANTAAAAAEPAAEAARTAKTTADTLSSEVKTLATRVENLEKAGKSAFMNGGDPPAKEGDKKSGEHSNPPQGEDNKAAPAPKTEGAKKAAPAPKTESTTKDDK